MTTHVSKLYENSEKETFINGRFNGGNNESEQITEKMSNKHIQTLRIE